MKFKILLFLTLAYTNVFAHTTLEKGVILLSHVETHGETLPAEFKKSMKAQDSFLSVIAYPVTGYAGQMVRAKGTASATIFNRTSDPLVYYYDVFMCIDGSNCTHYKDSYLIPGNVKQDASTDIHTDAYIEKAGIHEDEITLQISGSERMDAFTYNTVTIL